MAMVDISNINSMEQASILSHASVLSLEEYFLEPTVAEDPPVSHRRVGFSDAVEVIASASPLDLLEPQERSCIWYEARDLDDFRTEARDLCRQMRSNMAQEDMNNTNSTLDNFLPRVSGVSLARDNQTRGLEQRSCLERQRRRYLANKCIVRAQYKLTPERLSALSQKCTHWAQNLATEEAARDFVRAYVNIDHDAFPSPSPIVARMVVPGNNNKRQHTASICEEQESRRVRARLS
jgi:hypothetical protein